MNKQYYLDVNHFARQSSWAHGFFSVYAVDVGLAVLGLLVIVAWWRARGAANPSQAVAAVLWVALGTLAALAIAQPINHLVAEARPFVTIPGAEVLVGRARDFGFPSDHATVAGAVIAGLWLVDRLLAGIATLAGLLLAFARVYVGVHYPGDVLGGLLLGAAVMLVLWPLTTLALSFLTGRLERTPLRAVVDAGR